MTEKLDMKTTCPQTQATGRNVMTFARAFDSSTWDGGQTGMEEGKRSEELKAVNTDHTFKRFVFYRRGDTYLACGVKGHWRFRFFL